MGRLQTDDEPYQFDRTFLGPEHYVLPVQARYSTWAIFLVVTSVSILFLELTVVHSAGAAFGVPLYGVGIGVFVTWVISSKVDRDVPLRAVLQVLTARPVDAVHAVWTAWHAESAPGYRPAPAARRAVLLDSFTDPAGRESKADRAALGAYRAAPSNRRRMVLGTLAAPARPPRPVRSSAPGADGAVTAAPVDPLAGAPKFPAL